MTQLMGVRFAPSPTGRFHLGNLRTAWISHAWARALGQPWVVRIEDIDRPRVVAGAAERQLEDLAALGLVPEELVIQSGREARHWELFLRATAEGRIYPCTCSRKEVQEALAQQASAPHARPAFYSGACREGLRGAAGSGVPFIGWRFRSEDATGAEDFLMAKTASAVPPARLVAGQVRDAAAAGFVPAYPWACAIDDFDGRYALLVRASDLAHALEAQRAIQRWLGARELPAVFHAALVTGDAGERLEKRSRGVTLEEILGAGVGAEALLRAFEGSFRPAADAFAPGRIWGEEPAELRLGALGLPIRFASR